MRLRLAVTLAVLVFPLFAGAAVAQRVVFVVRHAEKATEANEPAVPLSEQGRARAARLASLLSNAGVTAAYATETERARRTAEPVAAAAAKLEIRTYAPRDAAGKSAAPLLVERIRKEAPDGVVLVVGHSNTVPEILAAFGDTAKVEIPSHQYDDLFVVVPRKEGGPPTVLRLKY